MDQQKVTSKCCQANNRNFFLFYEDLKSFLW